LYELFQRIDMTRDVFDFRAYTRLKQLEYLLRTGQIDNQFYWIGSTSAPASSETSCQLAADRAQATG
jgi:hypothetical protein